MKARMLRAIQEVNTFNRLVTGEVVDIIEADLPNEDGRKLYFACRPAVLNQKDNEFLLLEGDFEIL